METSRLRPLHLGFVVFLAVLGMSGTTRAADQPAGSNVPGMIQPGPEAKALDAFFNKNVSWTGTVPAGAMGPDSKEMASHGKADVRPLYGGFAYVFDVEDTFGSGKDAVTWKGHMVVGYDSGTKQYRGFSADNTGALVTWNGTLEGNKFVLESASPLLMDGQMMDDRLTWTRNPDGTLEFTDERRVQGGSWTVGERATMK